ncbi:hypothetical protein [Streptomyces pacificus]|nr:hypothetical protein [Streptomyces pacificus]
MLALIEELALRGHRVTFVTGSELAARLAISGATDGVWDVVGFLDDSASPVATACGYFADGMPELIIYDKTAHTVAAGLAPALTEGSESVCEELVDFLDRFELAFISGRPGLYQLVLARLAGSARQFGTE